MVTNPDRPAGRGLSPRPPPVKQRATAAGVPVLQPARARDESLREALAGLGPDVATVIAYGKIVPGELLAIPRLGFVNVHFSLLPAYRGAAPVSRALMDGVAVTGVSIIVLTEGMDEGPVLTSEVVPVDPEDCAGSLGARLAALGARLLVPTLEAYAGGSLVPRPQDHERATYAPRIDPAETRIDWRAPAERIRNLVRALHPEPGAWTEFRATRLKIHEVAAATEHASPGVVVAGDGDPLVGAGTAGLVLRRVQPAGKRVMSGAEWARGARPRPGERMG